MSPKQAPAGPQDGKEKPSRNLEMEGQRVRTITPSRKNRNTSTRQLRGAAKAEAKRSCSQKTVLTNAQPKKSSTNLKPKSQLPRSYQWNTVSREKETQVNTSKKSKLSGQNEKVVKAKLKQQGQGKESPPPPPPPTHTHTHTKDGRIHSQDRSTSNPGLNQRQRKNPRRGTTEG